MEIDDNKYKYIIWDEINLHFESLNLRILQYVSFFIFC